MSMGSMKPFLVISGNWSRLYVRRGLCNPPPPPPSKKNDTPESSWNIDKVSKDLSNRMEELKTSFRPTFQKTQDSYAEKANFWMRRYENFVGITEVKKAQHRVITAEQEFIESQEHRREIQSKITELQNSVKSIHSELEKTFRGEDRYLVLVTQEHQVLKEEKLCLEEFKRLERLERDRFSILSNAVRDSHEKERAQTEKTKYWSVIGSVFGSLLGIIGTTVNNRLKMRELRDLIEKATAGDALQDMYSTVSNEFKHLEDRFKLISNEIDGSIKGFTTLSNSLIKNPQLLQVLSGANNISDPDMKTMVHEICSILKDLTNQVNFVSSMVSNDSKNHYEKSLELTTNLQKNLSTLSAESKKNFKEISIREESLKEKMKDITSLLLSSTWNSFDSSNLKRTIVDYNKQNANSELKAEEIINATKEIAIGSVFLCCVIYVAFKLIG